jgi:hypothetical protein
MSDTTETTTMTGADAYSKAVEYALKAAALADKGANVSGPTIQNLAAVATAFAAIAQAEATARGSGQPGYFPGGGWLVHTHPDRARY